MSEVEEKKEDLKLELLRQHCQSIRHAEDERLTFTNFFILIVVGALAFISQTNRPIVFPEHWMIYIWLAGFSILGLVVSLRLKRGIKLRRDIVRQLIDEAGLQEYNIYGGKFGHTRIPSLRLVFPVMYGVAFVWFASLAVWCLLSS